MNMLTNFHCKICRSNNRYLIEDAISEQKMSFRQVAQEALSEKLFDCSLHSLEQTISRHYKKHIERELSYGELMYLENIRRGEVNLEELAEYMAHLLKHEKIL